MAAQTGSIHADSSILPNAKELAVLLLVFLVVCGVFQVYLHPLAKFPGPKLNASTYIPYNYWLYKGDVHLKLQEAHKRYGPIVRVGPWTLSVASVKGMEAVYSPRPRFTKPNFYETFGGLNKRWNLLSECDPHKHSPMRKVMSRCFSPTEMKAQEIFIIGHVQRFVERMRIDGKKEKGAAIAMLSLCYSSDSVSDLAMGKSFRSLDKGELHPWVETLESFFKAVFVGDIVRRYPLIFRNREKMLPKRAVEGKQRLAAYAIDIIEKRLADEGNRFDYVTIMDKAGWSHLDIRTNSASIISAGSDTVGNALTYGFYVLATNAIVYGRLVNELRESFSRKDEISMASTEKLPYLNAMINETLRCWPPVPNAGYRISPGCMIDGHWVPEGTECFTPAWTMHRSPEFFENPNEFLPERWMDPASTDQKKAFIPFSQGPNNCVGKSLALAELRLVFAYMCWEFKFELVSPLDGWYQHHKTFFLWQKPEIYVKVKERET